MPVMLGLPWLVTIIISVFSSIVTFLAQYVSKKLAFGIALFTITAGLFAIMVGTVYGILTGLQNYVIPDQYLGFWNAIRPSNLEACISAYYSARLAMLVYKYNARGVQMKLGF